MRWLSWMLGLLLLVGCRSGPLAGQGETCVRSAECEAPLVCLSGQCTGDLSLLDGGRVPSADARMQTPVDAGSLADAGPRMPDSGSSSADAGPPPMDAGPPPVDAGPPPVDAGPPPMDAGPPPVDASPPVDAGP